MNNETEEFRQEYLEHVRLHLWFSESPYSFHKGKASHSLAAKHLRLAHEFFQKYVESKI